MPDVWIVCDQDLKQDDQVQYTYDPKTGAVDAQLIQNWIAQTDGSTGRTSPANASNAAVVGGNSMPQIGGYMAGDYSLFQVTRTLPKRTGPTSFNVQIEAHHLYTPALPANKSNISITFSGQKFVQDAYNDSTGTACNNSAGDFFNPTLPKIYYDEKIQIEYVTTTDQSTIFAGVRGCVNNASLSFNIQGVSRTFPKRGLCCEDIQQSATLNLSGGAAVFKVTAEFISRTDTYVTNVLDQGLNDVIAGIKFPILMGDGSKATTNQMLDGSGGLLAVGGTPVFKTFKMENEADFTAIFTGLY